MFFPLHIIRCLFETFDKSAVLLFREFLAAQTSITSWLVASDYCLHDASRPADCFAFSIIPYDDNLQNTLDSIQHAVPRDIKKAKTINEETITFLQDPRRFHICFRLDKDRLVFTNSADTDPLTIAREIIRLSTDWALRVGHDAQQIARMKKLQQASLKKRFNVALMSDIVLLATFYSFVSLLLVREGRPQIIGWFSDRDKMTTWCDGVLWYYILEAVVDLGEQLQIPVKDIHFVIGVPEAVQLTAQPNSTSSAKPMWFDELIRLADHFAGTLAAWDTKTNTVLGKMDKFVRMFEDVIADARNLVILDLKIGHEGLLQSSRFDVSRTPYVV